MKTITFGIPVYFVTKHFVNENGKFDMEITSWITAEEAYKERDRWIEKHGEMTAFVFKGKQCMKVGD